MILTIELKKIDPDVQVMTLTGRITMGSDSQKIEWTVAELLKENHKKIIFDLTGVTFLDSSGVGILMMCHARLKKTGGALMIAGAQGMVQDALDITSVSKIINTYENANQAAQGFQTV